MIKILKYIHKEEWKTLLSDMKVNDIFFSPEYLKVNEIILKGESECFIYKDENSFVLYPYLRRSIEGSNLSDITSPYGYGGFIKYPMNSTIERFDNAFSRYCQETGVVSEFIRFHSLFNNHAYRSNTSLKILCHQPVVTLNYNQENFSLTKIVKKEALKKIKRAEQNQITVIDDSYWDYYQDFTRMYRQTMELKQSLDFYHFNHDFFEAIKKFLSNQSLLFIALYKGSMIGGLLVLYSDKYGYNYLSCSDYRYNRLGTNDLLQFKALDWAYKMGLKTYLLGGGMKGEDSLFRFKAKFSPKRKNFFIGKRIHLSEEYKRLCQEKIERENTSPEEFYSRTWFPLYRSTPPHQK